MKTEREKKGGDKVQMVGKSIWWENDFVISNIILGDLLPWIFQLTVKRRNLYIYIYKRKSIISNIRTPNWL
jgi:hypothetical protein